MEVFLLYRVEGVHNQQTPDSPFSSLWTHILCTEVRDEFVPVHLFAKQLFLVDRIYVLNIILCRRIVVFLESGDSSSHNQFWFRVSA